ncbi:cyclic-phosphate processing receiver domain-containing protein [Salinimicrobium sp. WS361]|uniref:cyclic-phosphate processing receiver domain-containing protein n=1 Tax=Salinimicrobium sp. WS361 TaxID=3425123 RepID=UPI003D6EF467
MTKLFLDDLRTHNMVYAEPAAVAFVVVRSYAEFVKYIEENGLPYFISSDNDLGLDENGEVAPDGYAAAKWLVYESGLDLRNLKFKVHSANPAAAAQIRGVLNITSGSLSKEIVKLYHSDPQASGEDFRDENSYGNF